MKTEHSALTESVYFILLAMVEPRHGYAVMQYVEQLTNGRVVIGAGTLYGAVTSLLEKRWIRAVGSDSRKKEYETTELGKKILHAEIARFHEMINLGTHIIGRNGNEN